MIKIIVEEDEKERLDSYLSKKLIVSRSKIQKIIKNKQVLVNGKEVSANYKVVLGDEIIVNDTLEFEIKIEAENIPLSIVYEDKYLMVINKKSGMVTHPAPGHYKGTLVNALLYYLHIPSTTNMRVGIVHRLDKDTSGLMLVSKDEKVLELLSKMIKEKEVKRTYLALVEKNDLPSSATIDAPIGRDSKNREKMTVTENNSKHAITHIKVLKRFKNKSLIECILDTGRTHQIRVHMSYIKHPIVNDPLYNNKNATEFGQMLHSKSIDFIHPITKVPLHFEVEPPKEFLDYLEKLEKE